jgi:16S rRNA (guanine1207-N2)-methyltransferase
VKKSDPFGALALSVTPGDDALLIGGDGWPVSVDRRNPKLSAWPEAGRRFATVALRLPKSRDEFAMLLHAAAGSLAADGTLYLFGGNDEGIGSAAKPLYALFAEVETATIKHHARVYRSRGLKADALVRGTLVDWRRSFSFSVGETALEHVTYPGVFAKDRLDDGTALLLEHLPEVTGRVLDFGAGSGPIAQVIRARHPDADITMADIDAIALEAARENVPGARVMQVRGIGDLTHETFDMIVSNPPVHTGVAQDFTMLEELVAARRSLLTKSGTMLLVLQNKVPLQKLAPNSQMISAGAGHTVWKLTA